MKKTREIIGIDEVGRGPVAGPVTVGAVSIDAEFYSDFKNPDFRQAYLKDIIFEKFNKEKVPPLRDSKKLTLNMKKEWIEIIKFLESQGKIKTSVLSFSNKKIDKDGISKCIKLLVNQNLSKLVSEDLETEIKLDGSLSADPKYKNQEVIIKGDEKEPVISLASIIAKVWRDDFMHKKALEYPEYLFENNVGYGTKQHLDAIKKYGITDLHRLSYLKNL